jgi:hypothetical protein
VEWTHVLVIGAAAVEGVDLPIEGAHGVEMLGNSLDQLDRQKRGELHP